MKALYQSLAVLLLIIGSAYYLFNYTNALGPYGTAGDVYHEIILISILFLTYIFLQAFILRRKESL